MLIDRAGTSGQFSMVCLHGHYPLAGGHGSWPEIF